MSDAGTATPMSEVELLQSPAFINDPYPFYRQLRAADPVHFIEPFNAWILTRFQDVRTAFTDDRFQVQYERYQVNRVGPQALEQDYFRLGRQMLVNNDPPLHTKLRTVFRKPFSAVRIRQLEAVLERNANELIDRFAAGRADLMPEYSEQAPLMLVSALLDIPKDEQTEVAAWVEAFYGALEVTPMSPEKLDHTNASARSVDAYFRGLVDRRRRRPGEDFVSDVLAANAEAADPLTEDQIVANLFLLYFAAHDTQKFSLGNMLVALDRNPEAMRRLAVDPSCIAGIMNELYRYDTVGQFMGRTVVEDVELGGRTIRAGQTLMLCMGAANRDPDAYPDPDRLDLDRTDAPEGMRHISFGAGRHHCLGSALTQTNVPILLRVLVERLPGLRVRHDEAVRHPSIAVRGYDSLPIVWTT